ncbi:MAG TPA: DUF1552 domain-containing protein [Polyangia bacterium]
MNKPIIIDSRSGSGNQTPKPARPRAPLIRRRTFLERLGLTTGAFLLGPSVTGMVRQAYGQTTRKRFVLMVQGNGMNFNDFAPPGHKPSELAARKIADTQLYQSGFPQVANMFAGLQEHRENLLLCDGLSNQTGEFDHTAGYGATTCVPNLPAGDGEPGGISFDQYLAKSAMGQGTVYPSMVLGPHRGGKGEGGTEPDPTLRNLVFAAGARQPVPVTLQATAAYKQYIANAVRDTAVMEGPAPYSRRKKILDFVREDVRRVQTNLKSMEKAKLDQVLGAFETLDKRMAELTKPVMAGNKITMMPVTAEPELEDRVRLHFEIWTTALVANLTNVVAFSAEATSYGCMWKGLGFQLGAHQHGHNEWAGEPLVQKTPGLNPLDEVHKFHAALLAKTITTLKGVQEGDRSLFDNTTIMWLNDGAEQHHPLLNRWPTLIATGSKNTAIKTGGRFLRYPIFESIEKAKPTAATVAEGRPTGGRCLADLYITMSHALGVPNDQFGMGGTEKVQGVLPEIGA